MWMYPSPICRNASAGRVYSPERINMALAQFFQEKNLQQLRELTLRELAAQLDLKFREKNRSEDNEDSANPDQVMICLSSRSPNADALLRYGSRLAGRLNRNWYALYVQTAQESATRIDAETQRRLSNTLRQVGATVFTFKSDDIVGTILQLAKEHRVGHIIIGPSGKKLSWLERLRGKSTLLEQLTLNNHDFKIVVTEKRRE